LHKSGRRWQQIGLKIGKYTGTDSTPVKTHNDPDGKYNGHYKKEMAKAHITMDMSTIFLLQKGLQWNSK